MSEDKYFVAIDNKVYGPYTLHALSGFDLLPKTLVATYNSGWKSASEYPELKHLFQKQSQSTSGVQRKMPVFDGRRLMYKRKRQAALIGVLTLGLAGLAVVGVGATWRNNLFAGTSLDHGSVGFLMKILSFMIISALVAIPFFVISFIQLIYYSIKLSNSRY